LYRERQELKPPAVLTFYFLFNVKELMMKQKNSIPVLEYRLGVAIY